ncbi:hypothetical protein [Anaerococcus tetradius]|uniref:Pyridoxal-dependent decarboxylase, pyridoxal binding domain protein n=1 Tax=Anaerococcus tetradius TaxID=33036 RepID=A0A133KEW8_9FIRM|nr:hypothetical protein [Anaerococcus tetradius]KWZ78066.1 Pyridoxal-dependent decarboxylase, pyridoxal binding domain protein [Anaerococcus tetradius]
MIELSNKTIKRITQMYGDSLYIFNKDEFIYNYNNLENTFKKIYPNYRICYSYKTNYTPEICNCVKKMGGYAEVVSDMEYQLALELGYSSTRIVFNGPIKGKYLESHILNGGINNIDRIEEAVHICNIADKNINKQIKTGIRVNFDIDAGYISRFGIDINKLDEIIKLLEAHKVIVNGIHCHLSRARGIEFWRVRAKKMIDLIEKHNLTKIEYISLGSGMYGQMDLELKKQFNGHIPSYQDYAREVLGQFRDFYSSYKNKPIVFTEPGTTLVSKYIDFLGKVIGIKEIRGKTFVLFNCSFYNLGETSQMKNLPLKIYKFGNNNKPIKNAQFVGYTCLEQDILYKNYSGELAVGDYVLFGNVGGYSIVQKPPFIMPDVPMITISNSEINLIKRQERYEDIFSSFKFKE